MSLKEMFGTDKKLEQEGITISYPGFSVKAFHASVTNKKYQETLSKLFKPYARFMEQGLLPDEKALEILQETVAKTIVVSWEGELEKGVPLPECNVENIQKIFKEYPAFWSDFFAQVQKHVNFQAEELEDISKNSLNTSSTKSKQEELKEV